MLTSEGRYPPTTVAGLETNTLWDGIFDLVEGIVDHHILTIHHVREDADYQWATTSAFSASGRCSWPGDGSLPAQATPSPRARLTGNELGAVGGLCGTFVIAFFVAALTLGIEVGASDREILDHYSDSGNRAKNSRHSF